MFIKFYVKKNWIKSNSQSKRINVYNMQFMRSNRRILHFKILINNISSDYKPFCIKKIVSNNCTLEIVFNKNLSKNYL